MSSFPTGQKWVLGITAGLMVASTAMKNKTITERARKDVLSVAAVAFVGVTIYDVNNKKVDVGAIDGEPTVKYAFTFRVE